MKIENASEIKTGDMIVFPNCSHEVVVEGGIIHWAAGRTCVYAHLDFLINAGACSVQRPEPLKWESGYTARPFTQWKIGPFTILVDAMTQHTGKRFKVTIEEIV